MTNLRDQLEQLFGDEPEAPHDVEHIVSAGRRARRRRQAAVAAAGTLGAAGLGAAVAIPMVVAGGGGNAVQVEVGSSPTPTPSATAGKCYFISAPAKDAKLTLHRFLHSGKVGVAARVTKVTKHGNGRTVLEVCSHDTTGPGPEQTAEPPAGPPYHYSEDPGAIASRLGAHLHDRVTGFGLSITYTRVFSQESTKPESGRPSYFTGNVDVHEANGYGDIGVQVTHETTEQVPFKGDCTAAAHCQETTLPDGSVLRTGLVKAGRGDTILTAEVHRPDGVVVQAQESDYPFGPDAGSQQHGDQPLTPDQLNSLAEDAAFTF